MNFDHTDDRRMLADTLQRFVAAHAGPLVRAKAAKTSPGYSRQLWQQFGDLGAIGGLMPEEHGGFGGGGFDLMVVFEALGAGLVAEPFLSALMSGRALALAGGHDTALAGLLSGQSIIAFAHQEGSGDYDLDAVNTAATMADRDRETALDENEKLLLHQVEHALDRMSEGAYGICEVTGAPIPVERLRAIPWATMTVAAAAQFDR